MQKKRSNEAGEEREEAKGQGDFFGGVASKLFTILGMGGQILAMVRDSAEKRAELMALRMGRRLVLQLWISAGIYLALLGLVFFIVDQTEIPRGLVYFAAGAVIALISLLLLHYAKRGDERD